MAAANGWKNEATGTVAMVLENDPHAHRMARLTAEGWKLKPDAPLVELADALRDHLEATCASAGARAGQSLGGRLVAALTPLALGDVDWRQLAAFYAAEVGVGHAESQERQARYLRTLTNGRTGR